MIGQLHPTAKTATIIGAGFSGLLIAYRLLQKGYALTIHEKSNRLGGLIETLDTPLGKVEKAAHSIRSAPAILQLCHDLNVEITEAKTKKKYILRDGKMQPMPLRATEFLSMFYKAFFAKADKPGTLADFARTHFGQAALDNLFTPLAHGIYAAEPEELDQRLIFPKLTVPEGKSFLPLMLKNRKAKEKSFVFAPRNGMNALVASLGRAVADHPKARLILNSEISTLPDDDNIIIATEAGTAGHILQMPELQNLRYAPMITATVFLRKDALLLLNGIGTLYARREHPDILGILFNSVTFDNRVTSNHLVSLSVMLGGTVNPEVLNKSDADLRSIIEAELMRVLGLNGDIEDMIVTRWLKAIPVYSPELTIILDHLKHGWCATPGRILAGNYTGEVSIRGMTESIFAKTV